MKVFSEYYEDVCKSSDPPEEEIDKFLNNVTIPKLAGDHRHNLDGNIAIQEMDWAITGLKADKSPGLDGLTVEFYKGFRDQLVPCLHELFKYCIEVDRMPPNIWR